MKNVGRVQTAVFQTSDGQWHLQFYRESQFSVQVFNTLSRDRLIEVLELASELQVHVDNISELPLTQYCIQSQVA